MRPKIILAGFLALFMIFGAALTARAKEDARALTIGLIPAENNEEMIQKFEPMRVYLEKALGEKVKVFTATDYTGVIEAMKKGRLDIAWFGPLSYVLAEEESNAEAFAVGIRKGTTSSSYKSIIITPCGSGIKSIQDLKGKTFAFVDPASTSGCLIPTYIIKKETGMMPQEFFGKIIYAGSHDAAELAVKNGTVDAGADDDITYDNMKGKGLITGTDNCIIKTSDPLPGNPLAYRKDMPQDLKDKVKAAFLAAGNEMGGGGFGNISSYVAASPKDYSLIRKLIKELGLRKEQILKK